MRVADVIIIGIDPGLTGAISILYDGGYLGIYDMPQQIKSIKRKRVKTGHLKGQMKDYPSYEVDAQALATMIHPSMFQLSTSNVKVYIEKVGAVYRADGAVAGAGQPLAATFQFGEGAGVVRGICEAYYGKENVTRVPPITWKKHFGLLKTEKDAARIYAINNILMPGVPELLKRKKDGGRADSLLIGTYGLHKELEKQ
jgi:crossover junction endodeoxyribonuclease RuvC